MVGSRAQINTRINGRGLVMNEILGLFVGCNGYDVLAISCYLVAYVVAVKFDNMKWKRGFRL